MTGFDRKRLRATFGEDAIRYDRCRPGYPSQLFDDLAVLARAGPAPRVLEIGCGTGQATLPLTGLGCSIIAVELSADMATIARQHLDGLPAVQVVVSAFEDWPLPKDGFDIVLSATAFHWVDPEVRMLKAADALHPEGALALVSTHHVAGGTESFFAEAQRCYERFVPDTPLDLRLQPSDSIDMDATEFDQSRRFGPVQFRRYEWGQTYNTHEYVDLLLTYSGHRAMPAASRQRLLACITDLINNSCNGQITKRYLTQLAIAHRVS